MGLKYLWDTNIVVYFLQNNFNRSGEKLIDNIATLYQPAISVITEIELLCWKTTTPNELLQLSSFITDSIIFGLESEIKLKTAEIRKSYNIKLPDAIIGATAIVMDLILISNDRGFSQVASLTLLNPFKTK